jgi:hypothetical protein
MPSTGGRAKARLPELIDGNLRARLTEAIGSTRQRLPVARSIGSDDQGRFQ